MTVKKGYGTRSRRSQRRASEKPLPPFPGRQMLILALCRICEPIAFMSIFPYIYHMVQDFNITEDESKISFYAGLVTSAFTFAEFSTGVMWGRLSDKVGRKPVLLTGLAGTGLSVLVFGFSPNLTVALVARALGGLLNGQVLSLTPAYRNIGVLQTTVGELITVKEHQPRAFTVMPMVWCLGSIIGPMIGGLLARPVKAFPSIFAPGSLWDQYPYLLPNLFSAVCVFMGLIVGVLFLEETHEEKKHKRDRGLELGKRLLSYFQQSKSSNSRGKCLEEEPLLDGGEQLPGYQSTDTTQRLASVAGPGLPPSLDLENSVITRVAAPERPSSPVIFTRPVVLIIITYGILAFHTMTFDQLFPVFLSTDPPAHPEPPSLPFKFVDGFGYDEQKIGLILSVQGLYSMFSTFFFFPFVNRRLGNLFMFKMMSLLYFLIYLTTPYLVLLPKNLQLVGVYLMIIWKCTFATMAYPSNAMLLTNAAPSTTTLGTINGVAASTASLCRAFGPTISGLLYGLGLKTGYSGLAWWSTALVAIAGAYISLQIKETRGRFDEKADDVENAIDRPDEAVDAFDGQDDGGVGSSRT
ncbi:MFS general substrate transporter [Coniochaeta ligniaria NRRL 30616]|uniref:MFS general substrate transporter n=1 Tax=Coniochaeta ligniaria NRRL 30616 TaxID=1408157 RepID=A0A1J7IWN4_9PEZI|nr:MFS general substrate transporter [Coniochaeta ligniaria NRRL 30616]